MNMMSGARMSEQQYDAERSKIARTKTEAKQQAGIRWEQQLAILFYRSGWTQEQLAKKEKITQPHAGLLVRFGKFLNFIDASINAENLPNNLAVFRFHKYWRKTEKGSGNERIRFQQVAEMIRGETTLSRPTTPLNYGPQIKEKFGDGKWYALDSITKTINAPQPEVLRSLELMCQRGTYGVKAERKRVGPSFHFRIFQQDKTISTTELIEKLTPIVKELLLEGKKNMATMSPATVAYLAGKLRNLLDEWAE